MAAPPAGLRLCRRRGGGAIAEAVAGAVSLGYSSSGAYANVQALPTTTVDIGAGAHILADNDVDLRARTGASGSADANASGGAFIGLAAGNVVTTPRTDLMYVVTEYGMANLKGRSIAERARALISIAHPDFREELERASDRSRSAIDLTKVAAGIQKLVFVVSIYDAVDRKQTFGMVNNAYIRLVNEATGVEVCKADLSEDFSVETSVCFAELYRTDAGEWKFKNVGQGYKDGLEKFVVDFGLTVE